MAVKPLPNREFLFQCFNYDPDTGVLTWKERPRSHFATDRGWSKFHTSFAGTAAGVVTNLEGDRSCILVCINGTRYLAHRIIWKMLTDQEPPEVDHWDGDDLNNRKANLRAADRKTNARNVKKHVDNPRMKGVYPNKKGWCSKIMLDGVTHHLGTYQTQEEAYAAYCKAARELHREFANFGEDRQRISP